MKNKIIGIVVAFAIFAPGVASASTLTTSQVSAIIGLLQAFGVAQSTIDIVYADLTPQSATTTPVVDVPTTTPPSDTTQPSASASTYTPPTQTSPTVTGVEQPAPVVPSCTLTYVEALPTKWSVHLRFTLTNTSGGIISGIDGTGAMRQMYNVGVGRPYQTPYQDIPGNVLIDDTYGYEYSTTTVYTLANKDTSCQVTVPPLSQN